MERDVESVEEDIYLAKTESKELGAGAGSHSIRFLYGEETRDSDLRKRMLRRGN